jgi:hypothetical protein
MKGEVAIRAVAMLELVRQGFQPRGDLSCGDGGSTRRTAAPRSA